ncbi:MAG: hypothetical protein CVU43_13655 [Chloroflexi bacterium HGW-Chloroflexi-5]|jgi:hypothetical protein|nr:MAG: hypothetical protein CVU43_13655 [Chloroflexi bacterium HGW-Chloroflexi-5]
MKSPLSVLVAVLSGLLVLVGYFFPFPALIAIRTPMLDWAVTLAGIAGLVAIINLIVGVHLKRLREAGSKRFFSVVVIITFLIVAAFGFYLGPADPNFQKVVTAIQTPIETSLMALLAITLTYSSLKMLQRQRNWMGLVFFLSVILFLVINSGVLAFSAEIPLLQDLLSGFHHIPAAGARGILLGIALGSLATGVRILIGSDKPYSG